MIDNMVFEGYLNVSQGGEPTMPMPLCPGSPSEIERQAYNCKSVMARIVAFSLAGWLICSCAYAQTTTGNNYRKFRITLGGGWANYDMKLIGGSYQADDTWSQNFDKQPYNGKRISGGPGIYGEVGMYLTRSWSINTGVLYLTGEGGIPYQHFLDDYINVVSPPRRFQASLVSPYIKLRYEHRIEPFTITWSAGTGYISGHLRFPIAVGETIPPQIPHEEYRAFSSRGGIGYMLSVGALHRVSGPFCFGSELGYRLMRVGHLKDKAGNVWEGMDLDFGGPYISGGFSLEM